MVAQLVPAPHPILGCVEHAAESVQTVRDTQPTFMTPAEKTAAVVAIARLEAMTAELKLRVLAAAGDAAAEAGARDTGAWLASVTRIDVPDGRAQVGLAEALDRRWHRLAAGMADGVVSAAQARVVIEALDALPKDLDPGLLDRAEVQMVSYCAQFRPSELRRLGRHLLQVVAPEIAEAELAKRLANEEQRAREKTSLRTRYIGDGLSRTTITHPIAECHRLLTYLNAFTNPRKHPGTIAGDEDRIPRHRRLGQAFGALLEHLDTKKLPAHGGDATTVLVTITLDALRNQLGTGTIPGGEPLSATAIRRLACGAGLVPVVLGGKGEILDLGRTRRLFSPAQRKALRLKHHRCQAEGCGVPADWCEAHHDTPGPRAGRPTSKTAASTATGTTTAPTTPPTKPSSCPTATSDSTDEPEPTAESPRTPLPAEQRRWLAKPVTLGVSGGSAGSLKGP